MRLISVLFVLCAVGASPQQKPRCKKANKNKPEGKCPISLMSSPVIKQSGYSENINVSVWIKDVCPLTKITISGHPTIYRPVRKRDRSKLKDLREKEVVCKNLNQSYFEMDSFNFEAGKTFSVTYTTNSSNCTVSHQVAADPQPEFSLSVNKLSKNISITVDSDQTVNVRLCYQNNRICSGDRPVQVSKSAVLSIPHMLPCLCVEVFFTYTDARRNKKCLFQNESVIDVRDIWDTVEVEVFPSYVMWSYECPANVLNVSASLCWKQHEHLCTSVFNSTLQVEKGHGLKFETSTVDKHPKMCVQFSLQGSSNTFCLFQDEKPSWETSIEAGRQSILVHFTSMMTAKFSAQLCVPSEWGCTPRGPVLSVTVTKHAGDKTIYVPVHDITEKPCVQVWQSDPALTGRRIFCKDYAHNRWGLCLVAVFSLALLGYFIYRATKSGSAGLLVIQRPLLLVCSSNQSTHISAVCALASLLQGELGAMVHTSLWAKNSQKQSRNGDSVADLGPLPWLYGQWEAVCKAQGKILIIWSQEAKRTYERWKAERGNALKNGSKQDDSRKANLKHERIRETLLGDFLKLNGKGKKEKSPEGKDFIELFEDTTWCSQKERSTVIEPVFMAALASLEGALQKGRCEEVAIVYFQGFCHSRDIPKAFRGVQSYCLPQDFSKIVQDLGEVRGVTDSGEFRRHCWYGLLSKVKLMWLARQLAQRLQAVLPQTQQSSIKLTSD